ILVPLVVWNLGICFDPESKLVEIREGNASVAHSLDQVLPQRGGKVGPQFDFGHYLPKTMCPSSSPRRSTSFGSAADRKRSASSKKPQGSPQNRPMRVTSKPANRCAARRTQCFLLLRLRIKQVGFSRRTKLKPKIEPSSKKNSRHNRLYATISKGDDR